MINYENFYDNMEFMVGLFINGLLSNDDIYNAANALINKYPDDPYLMDILVASYNDDYATQFEKFTTSRNLGIKNKRVFLVKQIFKGILDNKIDMMEGMRFISEEGLYDYFNTKKYVGDAVGIAKIYGAFWDLEDSVHYDIKTELVEEAKKDMLKEMKKYVKNYKEQ